MEELNEKEKFLNKIQGKEEILRMFSLDRLKILDKYYDEDIRKKKEEIKELRKQLSK